MNTSLFEQLQVKGLITEETLNNIKASVKHETVTVKWELKTLMYVGVLLLTTGLGIIVYKNINTIGHLALVTVIAVATIICFAYSLKKAPPFTFEKATSSSPLSDYILLLGCLLLLIFIGYIQFQYQVFGSRWGMATFIPMIILFISAYYFDHLGVLSLAIVNLAALAGITVTPLHRLRDNNFSDSRIILTGFSLGILLTLLAWYSDQRKVKQHFAFTYKNFGTHFLFLSSIAAVIHFDKIYLLWFLALTAIAYFQFTQSVKEKSFYFLVITALYFYVGISYVLMHLLFASGNTEVKWYLAFIYFIASGFALVSFLMRYNILLKKP